MNQRRLLVGLLPVEIQTRYNTIVPMFMQYCILYCKVAILNLYIIKVGRLPIKAAKNSFLYCRVIKFVSD